MPGEVQEAATAITGLDNLEIGQPPARDGLTRTIAARGWAALWPKALAILIVLAAWELVYQSNWHHLVQRGVMQSPAQVLANLWGQMQHAVFWSALGNTVRRAIEGYGLAVIVGTAVGALVSRIRPLRAAVGSLITGLQTMPSIAWYPLAIILFGPATSAIMFVIVLGSAPSVANGLIAGVDYTPPILLRAGKTMGLRGLALYRHLILPASLPAFVAGLKQAWAFAWRSLVAGELIVQVLGVASIGVLLQTDQDNLDFSSATALIIVILVLGVIVDMLFSRVDGAIRKRWGVVDSAELA